MSYATPWSKTRLYFMSYFHFESPNNRSEPLDVISILKCAWRLNFTFFGIFLLFIKPLWKSLIQWSRKCKISDFQSGLINSKKISKNVKFGLQAHLNIYIASNGSDWLFGLWKQRKMIWKIGYIWMHKNLDAFEPSSKKIVGLYYMCYLMLENL